MDIFLTQAVDDIEEYSNIYTFLEGPVTSYPFDLYILELRKELQQTVPEENSFSESHGGGVTDDLLTKLPLTVRRSRRATVTQATALASRRLDEHKLKLVTIFKKIDVWDRLVQQLANGGPSVISDGMKQKLREERRMPLSFNDFIKKERHTTAQMSEHIMKAREEDVLNKYDKLFYKFIKYTTLSKYFDQKSNLPLVNPRYDLNITSFIKHNVSILLRLGLTDPNLVEEARKLLDIVSVILDPKVVGNIKRLRYLVTKWWYDHIDHRGDMSRWARTEMVKFNDESPSSGISDKSIRQEFLKDEFGVKQSKNKIRPTTHDESVKEIEVILRNKSDMAQRHGALGNNAAGSHYDSEALGKKKLHDELAHPIMNLKYNCNWPNVIDPMSQCPKWGRVPDGRIRDPISIKLEVSKEQETYISFEINPTGRTPSGPVLDYKILFPGGESLEGKNRSINEEPLSKSNVLRDVFLQMNDRTQPADFTQVLERFVNNSSHAQLKNVIVAFCFKLFGDFGQELFSVQQSFQGKPTVFVSNDWISTIRYFFLHKWVNKDIQLKKADWWGGFLGPSYFILYEIAGLTGASKAPIVPKKRKKSSRSSAARKRKRSSAAKKRKKSSATKKRKKSSESSASKKGKKRQKTKKGSKMTGGGRHKKKNRRSSRRRKSKRSARKSKRYSRKR